MALARKNLREKDRDMIRDRAQSNFVSIISMLTYYYDVTSRVYFFAKKFFESVFKKKNPQN